LNVTGIGEIEHTKLNEKVIIQRIAKDLYKNASSGLRELYMNSVRACRDTIKLSLENYSPRITVTINEENRTLIIEDNGIGITEQMYQQVLRELGTSSNLDGKEIGQFGMGFASYMTLSSVVIIDTMSVNGASFKRIAKDGQSFQRLGNADRKVHGTTLSMTCYSEVDFNVLIPRFYDIARYSGIPTFLMLDGFEYVTDNTSGINEIEQCKFNDDVLNEKTEQCDLVDIETDDFHLIALVAGANNPYNRNHVYLLNVPIQSDINLPFSWWVLNIKDERKFLPMPDRDRLREESDKKLSKIIGTEIKKYFLTLDIMTYQQFLTSNRKKEFLWLCSHNGYALPNMQSILSNLLECVVRTVEYDTKQFWDGSLILKLQGNSNIIYQNYKDKKITDKIEGLFPNSLIMTVKKTKKINWKEQVEIMKAFGIPFTKQILIDNKVKIPKRKKSEEIIIGHTHSKYYESSIVSPEDIDKNVIKVDGDYKILDVISFVRSCSNPYIFVKDTKSLDETDCTSFTEWMKTVGDIVCATNQGAKTVKELGEWDNAVYFCSDFKPEYEDIILQSEKLVVYGTNQLLPFMLYIINMGSGLGHIRNNTNQIDISSIIEEVCNVRIYDDTEIKFFCDNLKNIAHCFHELFGKFIASFGYDIEMKEQKKLMTDILKLIKSFDIFDETDELEKLQFYNAKYIDLEDKSTLFHDSISNILVNTKDKIRNDVHLLGRFVREMLIPKMFGKVIIKNLEKLEPNYRNAYKISFVSYQKDFNFQDVKVYDFDVSVEEPKFRVTKAYVGVKLLVVIE